MRTRHGRRQPTLEWAIVLTWAAALLFCAAVWSGVSIGVYLLVAG